MSSLGFQTVYRLFNDAGRRGVRAGVPAAEAGTAGRSWRAGAPLLTLESQTPVARLRRDRVLGVVRVGLHERRLDAAAGGLPAARPSATRRRSARRDRRRRDVREPRAARAVRRRRSRPARARCSSRPWCGRPGRRGSRSELLRAPGAASAGSTSRRSTTSATRRRHASPAFEPRPGTGRAGRRQEGGREERPSALDPPATSIFTPDTEFGSRFLDRGRARLREPVPVLLGGLQLPAGARVPRRSHPGAGAARARAHSANASGWCRSRSAITRRSSASCSGLLDMGYSISPASLRLDDLTAADRRSCCSRAASGPSPSRPRPDPTGCAA